MIFLIYYLFLAVLGLCCCMDFSLVVLCRLLIATASLVAEHEPCAQAKELRCTGWVALQHVGSSWTRDRTQISCIGRQIHYH